MDQELPLAFGRRQPRKKKQPQPRHHKKPRVVARDGVLFLPSFLKNPWEGRRRRQQKELYFKASFLEDPWQFVN